MTAHVACEQELDRRWQEWGGEVHSPLGIRDRGKHTAALKTCCPQHKETAACHRICNPPKHSYYSTEVLTKTAGQTAVFKTNRQHKQKTKNPNYLSQLTFKREKSYFLFFFNLNSPVPLKMGKSHHNWYACVQLDYYHAVFQRCCLTAKQLP